MVWKGIRHATWWTETKGNIKGVWQGAGVDGGKEWVVPEGAVSSTNPQSKNPIVLSLFIIQFLVTSTTFTCRVWLDPSVTSDPTDTPSRGFTETQGLTPRKQEWQGKTGF